MKALIRRFVREDCRAGRRMTNALASRLVEEDAGQDLIEYVLLAASMAVIAIPTIAALGTAVTNVFAAVAAQLARG